MKLCGQECKPFCDLCRFYKDYGIIKGKDVCQGIGICELDITEVLATDFCYNSKFVCTNAK